MIRCINPVFTSIPSEILKIEIIGFPVGIVFNASHEFVELNLSNFEYSLLHENRGILYILVLIVDSGNNLKNRCIAEPGLLAYFFNKVMRIKLRFTCIRFGARVLSIIQITYISYPHALNFKDIIIDSYFIQ